MYAGVESVGCRVDGRRKRVARHEHQAGRLGTRLHQYTLVLLDSPYQGMIAGAPQDRFPPLGVCHLDPSRVPSHGQSGGQNCLLRTQREHPCRCPCQRTG